MDSVFDIQQYIQQSLRDDPSNFEYFEMPENQDMLCWQYEHLRFIVRSLIKDNC
jgi:hypothetical protein